VRFSTMSSLSFDQRRELEALDRRTLERLQLEKLNRLLAPATASNKFSIQTECSILIILC